VFSHQHPRTTARGSRGRRLGATITSLTLGTAFALAGAGTATAADNDGDHVSWAQAQFLSGSVAGVSLDTVASIEPAEAWNDGDSPTMTDKDPLKVKVLDTIPVGTGDSVQITTDGVQAGVLGQYAVATADGQSFAAVGAVLDDGGVGIGEDVAMPGANAEVDLSNTVGGGFISTLTDLRLSLEAIGAQAQADGPDASGDYRLDGAVLHFTSPAISNLTQKVNAALDSVDNRLALLSGHDGALLATINGLLQKIAPSLGILGVNATASASIETDDLRAGIVNAIESEYGGSGIRFDLETGEVSIDLAALHGGDLNNLPPGTELLSSPVINAVLHSITGKIQTIAEQIVDRVEAALHNATLTISAGVDSDVAQSPLVEKVCETVKQVVQVPTQVIEKVTIQVPVIDGVIAKIVDGVPVVNGVPIVGNLLGGTLGGILGGTQHTVTWITQTVDKTVTKLVDKTVDKLVCTNKITQLPVLQNGAQVNLTGTIDEFLSGAGVDGSASLKVLGVTSKAFSLPGAIDSLAGILDLALFGDDGAIQKLRDALQVGLVTPALDGLLDGDAAVGTALTDILSAKVNVQEMNDGTFTETALQITALGGLGSLGSGAGLGGVLGTSRTAPGLAQVNLAQAAVGPNVTGISDPGCVVNCGVGGVTTTPAGGVGGVLAMTGVNIGMLILMVLALLAAGAYLVRESYRHRHSVDPIE
jgi:hypothetical protein